MSNVVKFIPDGFHTVSAYLTIKGAAQAIEFYKKAFGAVEKGRLMMGEKIGHAELWIGDSVIMVADEFLEWGNVGPETLGGTTVSLAIFVEDVDVTFQKALDAGAKVSMAIKDEFYGDRRGAVIDPFGHKWSISTHKEDVSYEEMQKRMDELMKKQ